MESSSVPELQVGTSSSPHVASSSRHRFAKDIRAQRTHSPFASGSVLVDSHLVDAEANQTVHPGIREAHLRPSALKVGDEDRLREEFGIPPQVGIRIPGPDETVVEPKAGEVAFFVSLLKLGLSFPLPDFICHFLQYFHLCPIQLALNGWRYLLGCLVLSELNLEPLQFGDIRAVSSLKESKPYGYYITMTSGFQTVIGLPDTNKGWQDEYFFLSGEDGDIPKTPGLIRKPLGFIMLF